MVALRAERMAAGGDAIAREPGGRIVFVEGAIPGELVEVTYLASKKDFAKARVAEVLEPSDARIVAPCTARRAGCGGCGWQHIDPAAQRDFKVDVLRDALRRTGRLEGVDIRLGPVLDAERARTTVRAAVDSAGRLGFRAARSHELVVPESCLVIHPMLDQLLVGGRFHHTEEVVLRLGSRTGERLAWGCTPGASISGLPVDVAIGEDAVVHEIVHGHRMQISAPSFFQSSPEAAEAIIDAVVDAGGDLLAGATSVVDAYGGAGLLAIGAAPSEATVTLIDREGSSTRDAAVNLADRRAILVNGDVEDWTPSPADVVIADPARRGLGREAITRLAATGCRRLVLVSCDPVSAARDARDLCAEGFDLIGATVLDPFPHTPHLEVISRFDRSG